MKRKTRSNNKASIAALLELGGGYFGLLGLGWIYAGEAKQGLLFLGGYITFLILGILTVIYTLPCFIFIFALFYFGAPLLSAVKVYEFAQKRFQ